MPVEKILGALAAGIAALATAIAGVGLLHELVSSKDVHMLMHNLEAWVSIVAFHTALILLAAAGINYLARKK